MGGSKYGGVGGAWLRCRFLPECLSLQAGFVLGRLYLVCGVTCTHALKLASAHVCLSLALRSVTVHFLYSLLCMLPLDLCFLFLLLLLFLSSG